MRFLFTESFDLRGIVWNGELIRKKNGISGTHSASIFLAEALASLGNDVYFVSKNIIDGDYLGVHYINDCRFQPISCDYIITTYNINDLFILDKITNFNKIIILMNNDLFGDVQKIINMKNHIIIAYLNESSKQNILTVNSFLQDFESIFIPNSIDISEIKEVNIQKKENALCFFACPDRGLRMVMEIVKEIDFKLYTNNVLNESIHYNSDSTQFTEANSKYVIYDTMSKCKYFVYPLINLENNRIHYDTFAYVVLEALLHQCIVICPKMDIFVEVYGDSLCYIDTDDMIPQDDLKHWRKINANFGLPILKRYVDKIKELEENENKRNEYIQKGLALKEKFSNIECGKKVVEYLNQRLTTHLRQLSQRPLLPQKHIEYLMNLKRNGFEPKVIYDIGSCVLHWAKVAQLIWTDAEIILFDAFAPAEFLYEGRKYHIGVLSDSNDKTVSFYQNEYYPGGNSYYREIGCENGKYFPVDKFIQYRTNTIDSIIEQKQFPLPDLIKIDAQGSEMDIINGGIHTFQHAQHMVVELQHTNYNEGARLANESISIIEQYGWKCIAPLFQNNGCDGDYGFARITSDSS